MFLVSSLIFIAPNPVLINATAYGIGPMLSPLQELPVLGRNPVYMATLFFFVIFQIPIVTAKNRGSQS
jgi:hypothetical protein